MFAHASNAPALAARYSLAVTWSRRRWKRRLRTIRANIAAHLGDPGLSVGAVAVRQRVTPRYVHRLFEGEGVTLTEFVLRHV